MFALILILSLSCVFIVRAHSSGDLAYSGVGYSGIQAAIQSTRTIKLVAVPQHKEPPKLTIIDIDPVESPVSVQFLSASSPVAAEQVHTPGEPGLVKVTASQEEPHRLIHTITKPVIQEVREIIFPYRFLQQKLLPVQEQVNTVIAKSAPTIKSVESTQPILINAPPMVEAPAPPPTTLKAPVSFGDRLLPAPLAAPALLEEAPVAAVGQTLTVPITLLPPETLAGPITQTAPETLKVPETLTSPVRRSAPETQIAPLITPLTPLVSNRKASFKSWGY